MDIGFLFTLAILILSVIIHEVAHGYAADSLGDPTARYEGRLTLNPIPHIDPVGSVLLPLVLALSNAGILFGWAKPVPYNPYNLRGGKWAEAFVGFAGPLSNIALALLFSLIIRLDGTMFTLPAALTELSLIFVAVNVLLALFNLIPIPPLDGSKILYAVLPYHLSAPLRRMEESLAQFGLIATFAFIFLFIFILSGPFFRLVRAIVTLLTGEGGL